MLLLLGGAGLVLSLIKKNLFLVLWIMPYLILVYLVGWVTHFHWILLLPAFTLGGAIVVNDLMKLISNHTEARSPLIVNVLKVSVVFSILSLLD